MIIKLLLTRKGLINMWLKFLNPLDNLIDGVSMYRLLLYYLIALLVVAFGMSLIGIMHYNPIFIALSAIILVFACWAINRILAAIFHAPINPESSILTGLILALIVPPKPTGTGLLFLLAVSGLAMASKYILTINKKHIFNPAAIAVVLTALGPHQSASWWVGTASMLPFVIIGGILITRKVQREHMVIMFLVMTTLTTAILPVPGGGHVLSDLINMALNSAVFFLGFVMLTEPYTSPTTRNKQLVYAAIVGIIMAPQFHIGSIYSTPEIALVIGNLFAYITGSKIKLFPTLFRKYKISADTAEFAFVTDQKFDYIPGQYMEFTLPHDHPDSRGSRRYFTLSSSPTEEHLKVGVKFYEEGSTYKAAMIDINQNTPLVASQLAGDFIMPEDSSRKLVFIAGGIGVTPFRSMIKYLIDTKEKRDIILIYSVYKEEDIAYRETFSQAKAIGLKTIFILTGKSAKVTKANTYRSVVNGRLIKKAIPDFNERLFYISGSHGMVESLQESLHEMGIKHADIKTDFFPGYA